MHQWTWNVCHFGNLFTVNWHILSIGLFVFYWPFFSWPSYLFSFFFVFWPTWWSCGELEITGVCSRLWGQTSLPQWAAVLPRLHIQGLFFLLLASFSMCVFNNWKSYPYPFAEWSNSTSSKLVPDEESRRYRFYIWVKISSLGRELLFWKLIKMKLSLSSYSPAERLDSIWNPILEDRHLPKALMIFFGKERN